MTFSPGRLLCASALSLSVMAAGCGSSSNKPSSSGTGSSQAGSAPDRAFLSEIIPNDELAVANAKLAQTHATHMQLKVMAGHIIAADTPQIAQLTALAKSMGVTVDAMNPTSMTLMTNNTTALGIGDMNSVMDSVTLSTVASAKPFDKTYMKSMEYVLDGAETLSQAELMKGTSTQLHSVASATVTDAGSGVAQLKSWNSAWYGKMAGMKGMSHMKGMSGMSGMVHSSKKKSSKKKSMSGMGGG